MKTVGRADRMKPRKRAWSDYSPGHTRFSPRVTHFIVCNTLNKANHVMSCHVMPQFLGLRATVFLLDDLEECVCTCTAVAVQTSAEVY